MSILILDSQTLENILYYLYSEQLLRCILVGNGLFTTKLTKCEVDIRYPEAFTEFLHIKCNCEPALLIYSRAKMGEFRYTSNIPDIGMFSNLSTLYLRHIVKVHRNLTKPAETISILPPSVTKLGIYDLSCIAPTSKFNHVLHLTLIDITFRVEHINLTFPSLIILDAPRAIRRVYSNDDFNPLCLKHLTTLSHIILSSKIMPLLPPNLTSLHAVIQQEHMEIDKLSYLPLQELKLKANSYTLVNPENFPYLVILHCMLYYNGICFNNIILPSKLKEFIFDGSNRTENPQPVQYGNVELDYIEVIGAIESIPKTAYSKATVVKLSPMYLERKSLLVILDNISSTASTIEIDTLYCKRDINVHNGVEYDFSRFTKCTSLFLGIDFIRPTKYPQYVRKLTCKNYAITVKYGDDIDLWRRIAMAGVVPPAALQSMKYLDEIFCSVDINVISNPDCFKHVNKSIRFVTTEYRDAIIRKIRTTPSNHHNVQVVPLDEYNSTIRDIAWPAIITEEETDVYNLSRRQPECTIS